MLAVLVYFVHDKACIPETEEKTNISGISNDKNKPMKVQNNSYMSSDCSGLVILIVIHRTTEFL